MARAARKHDDASMTRATQIFPQISQKPIILVGIQNSNLILLT